MSVDVIPPGQRRRIAVIGSGNKRCFLLLVAALLPFVHRGEK